MILLAVPLGALIGLSLGALGGGGSILTVPVLVYILDQPPHGSTTASLIIVGITALAGMAAHLRAGRVQVRAGLIFGILGSGGSYLGSRLSASLDPNALLAAFSVLIAVAAVTMLRRRSSSDQVAHPVLVAAGAGGSQASTAGATGDPRPSVPSGRATPLRIVAAASVVGLFTGLFGVGGGFVVVPALVLALGLDMATAVGTSLLVIAINSASALAVRLSASTHLDVPLLAAFSAAAIAGTLAGSRVASRTRPEKLRRAFALLLIAVAAYTASRSIPHLV